MNTFINSLKVNSIDEAFIDIFKQLCDEDEAFDDLILRQDKKVIDICCEDKRALGKLYIQLQLILQPYKAYTFKPMALYGQLSFFKIYGFNSLEELYGLLKLIV